MGRAFENNGHSMRQGIGINIPTFFCLVISVLTLGSFNVHHLSQNIEILHRLHIEYI